MNRLENSSANWQMLFWTDICYWCNFDFLKNSPVNKDLLHWLYPVQRVRDLPKGVLVHDTKLCLNSVLVLEVWVVQNTPSLPLLPGPLCPRVLAKWAYFVFSSIYSVFVYYGYSNVYVGPCWVRLWHHVGLNN